MKNRKLLLSVICAMLFLSGCSLKLKTREVEKADYQSIGNEMKIFGFGIGENKRNIHSVLGETTQSNENMDVYADKKITIYYGYNLSRYFVTTNPKYTLIKKIKIGIRKNELIHDFSELDLFEYKSSESGESYIFFNQENKKVVMSMEGDRVKKIILADISVPLDELINKKVNQDDVIPDEEIIKNSQFLTFNLDLSVNNKVALKSDFFNYTELGLVEGVPLPIETSKYELIRRFGQPNYVFEGKNDIKEFFYYKKFNLYLGIDKTDKISEIKLPVYMPISTFKTKHGLSNLEQTQINNYEIEYEVEDGNLIEINIKAK